MHLLTIKKSLIRRTIPKIWNSVHQNNGIKKIKMGIFGQDGSIGRHGSPLCTNASKLQLKYRTTITPNYQKLSWMGMWQLWNQVEWKSANYGIKETTSRQTSGRGADAEWAGPTPTRMKIWEGCVGSEGSQNHTRPSSPGFQGQVEKSPQFMYVKTSRDWVGGGGCWSPKWFLLGNPHTDSPTQNCSLWASALG